MTEHRCTSHPDIDYLFGPLTPASLARMRAEVQADMRRRLQACPSGHAWAAETTRVRERDGARVCRVCERQWTRTYRARKKGAA